MKKKCYLCNSIKHNTITNNTRDVKNLPVLQCKNCGLVFLSDFKNNDVEFYKKSKMRDLNQSIAQWLIETKIDDSRRFKTFAKQFNNKNVLDFGCGNAQFVLSAAKKASYCVGLELDDAVHKYYTNKLPNNSKLIKNLSEVETTTFDVITMFHVIEHLSDPISVLKNLSLYLNKGGSIIIETPNFNDALLSLYGSEGFKKHTFWSCHLYTYSEETLTEVLKRSGFKKIKKTQIQRYPISNHLFWLAHGLPGGHQKWPFLNSPILIRFYERALSKVGACDTLLFEVTK